MLRVRLQIRAHLITAGIAIRISRERISRQRRKTGRREQAETLVIVRPGASWRGGCIQERKRQTSLLENIPGSQASLSGSNHQLIIHRKNLLYISPLLEMTICSTRKNGQQPARL